MFIMLLLTRNSLLTSFTRTHFSITILTLIDVSQKISGDITVSPRSQLAFVGDTVRLNCSTNLKLPVNWLRTTVMSHEKEIFILNRTKSDYAGRMFVKRDAVGQYDLVIPQVTLNDSGRYTCVDRAGGGNSAKADLIIIGYNPRCYSDSNIDYFPLTKNNAMELNICLRYDRAKRAGCPTVSTRTNRNEQGRPSLISLFPYKSIYPAGQQITCLAIGTPSPTYNWVNSEGTIIARNSSEFEPFEAGMFKCVATHELGSIHTTFSVSMEGSASGEKDETAEIVMSGVPDNINTAIFLDENNNTNTSKIIIVVIIPILIIAFAISLCFNIVQFKRNQDKTGRRARCSTSSTDGFLSAEQKHLYENSEPLHQQSKKTKIKQSQYVNVPSISR